MVESVHGSAWRIYAMERSGGLNSRSTVDMVGGYVERQGCYYTESQGDVSRFRPDSSSRGGNPPSLHFAQEETVSIACGIGDIKTDYILHDVDEDCWFSVSDTMRDGAGNTICTLAKAKALT